MPDAVEPIATADRGEATMVGARATGRDLADPTRMADRTRHALDMIALGTRKIAKYETLLGRLVGEIGRFADAARRERTQLEEEVKTLRQELHALRKEHAATEQRLINSQLDCWSLQLRIQAMKDARTLFDGMRSEPRPERTDDRIIDAE